MDKILSARVDESILRRIGLMAEQMKTSKKTVIENAILLYAEQVETEASIDILDRTLGAWDREESPEETFEKSRTTFHTSMERHRT